MSDADQPEPPETDFERARRFMFAYLCGLGDKQWREAFGQACEAEHKEHTERNGACPFCEKKAAMDALSSPSPFFDKIPFARARRFRNTGRKHK